MSAPAVSVVIPAFNRRATIRAAVHSVLRQTFTDIEIVIVDDGSTDGTLDALAAIVDPRVRCVAHPTNRGASAARNTGIAEAAAPWVAFQDSDDEWLPEKLEKQMARLAAFDPAAVACYCGMAIFEDGGEGQGARSRLRYLPPPHVQLVEGDILPALLETSFISTQTLVVRRAALLAAGCFDEALPPLEDWECMIRLAARGPVAFVDEPLVVQRISADSISRNGRQRAASRRMIIEKHHRLIGADRRRLANHHQAISGEYRRLADHALALDHAMRAVRCDPLSMRRFAILGYCALMRILSSRSPDESNVSAVRPPRS